MGKGKPRAGETPIQAPICWLCAGQMVIDSTKAKKRIYYCDKCGTETEVRKVS